VNKEQRKTLARLVDDADELRGKIDDLKAEIETVRDEEQDKFDNLPENFQDGDRGQRMQAAIDAMDEAIQALENIDIDEITNALNTATEE
jgi:uncharacterized coiled-coil DUF342 family protein